MKKWTKLFSLAIGALMAIGAAVGVKPTAEKLDAASVSGKEFSFTAVPADNSGLFCNGTFNSSYYKIVSGSYATISKSAMLESSDQYISSATITANVACATYGTWSGAKSIKVTLQCLDKDGKQLTTSSTTYSSLNSTQGTYRGDFTINVPSTPTDFDSLKIIFSDFTTGTDGRFAKVKLSYDYATIVGDADLKSISCEDLSLGILDSATQLNVVFDPVNAANKAVTYSVKTGSEGIIEVSNNGMVTPLAAGVAYVIITPADTHASPIEVKVTVNGLPEPAFAANKKLIMTGTYSGTKYELSGITVASSTYGTASTYATIPNKTYVLDTVDGAYENTISFKDKDGKYLYYNSSLKNGLDAKEIAVPDAESSWIISKDSSDDSLYEIKNVADQTRFLRFNGQSTRFACYLDGQAAVALYEIDTTPKVTISSADNATYFMAGNSLNFSKSLENIDEPATVVWATSNADKTSISSNGVLTAMSSDTLCTTKVSCTVNGTKSNEIEITIWSNNENIISLAKVIEIANFTSTTDTPYEYTTAGTVKSFKEGNSNEFVITDEDNDVTIYKSGNALEIGDYVEVSGCIRTNNGVPSIRSKVTLNYYYTVTFMNNGVQHGTTLRVKSGEKIDEPTTPTPTGSKTIFVGWFNENIEWDFDTDVVTSDLILTAKWTNGIDTQSQLNIKYTYDPAVVGNDIDSEITYNLLDFGTAISGYADFTATNNGAEFAGSAFIQTGTNDDIQFRSSGSNSGFYNTSDLGSVKKVVLQWASTNENAKPVNIYGTNTQYKSAADLFTSAKGTLIDSVSYSSSSIVIDINDDYKYIGIASSSGAVYFESITYSFSTSTPLTIKSVNEYNLRFSCELTADQIASSFKTPADWQCGFMVAQTAQMETTFEESYENLKDYFEISEDPIADVAAGAMSTGKNAKISMYANTMNQLPTPVGDKYEFSVNVTIPEANLSSSVSAVWFAYSTDTNEMVFASQKDMSIKDICGIYAGMGGLSESQQAAINYIAALAA